MGDIGIIGLDTNIFMNVLREESGTDSSTILLEQIESGRMLGVASVLILAEIATLFYREEDFEGGKRAIELLKDFTNLMWVDLTSDVVDSCAKLKVKYHLSLADAIILNAAVVLSADVFVTRDADFDGIDIISVRRPEDIIEQK
jgi:predicted nucleic acid-binding protein